MQYPSISLIIPCYNESLRIDLLVAGLKAFTDLWTADYELIIVDDGSTDGTDVVLQANPYFVEMLAQKKMTLLRQENTGKGGALKRGVAYASKDFILTLDADMATSPLELLHWLTMRKTFSEHEILIASRELKNSKVADSFKRKFVGNVFNFIIQKTVKLAISDTQCGFKLYPAKVAKSLFNALVTLGWAHDVELLLRAHQEGLAIVEMPVTWNAIEGSKIDVLRDSWKMFWEVMKMRKFKK